MASAYASMLEDTQLYTSTIKISNTDEVPQVLLHIEKRIADSRAWMLQNKLMINDLKTEFIVIASPQQEGKFTIPGISVGESLIPPTNQVRNLGVVFGEHLNIAGPGLTGSAVARMSTSVTSVRSAVCSPRR